MDLYSVIALAMIPPLLSASNISSIHFRGHSQIYLSIRTITPLCYRETTEGVNPKVGIFVKRFPATVGSSVTASTVWFIASGPGSSSTVSKCYNPVIETRRLHKSSPWFYLSFAVEEYMKTLHLQLEGKGNMYTMDHHDTGRSTFLDCVAAQAITTGSPYGTGIDPPEVPACANDLQTKYGDLASFSISTTATDLAALIFKYTNGRSTIVYDVSYGTVLVEKLVNFAPPEVKGYALDSHAASDEFRYLSNYVIDLDEVGDAFLSLCEKDNNCHGHIQPNGLNNTLQSLLEKFNNNSNSTCAKLHTEYSVAGSNLRTLILPVIYRLNRCSAEDVNVLTQFFTVLFPNTTTKNEDSAYFSDLLYNLIVFSEQWESPMPPKPELRVTLGMDYWTPRYCAFTKDKTKEWNNFNNSNYDGNGIIYKRDQYWSKTVSIPSQASVLLMSGTLDPTTPIKYVESFLKSLKGVDYYKFDFATHSTIFSTQMIPGSLDICGMRVLASYVRNGGDLQSLNKSCVDELPAINLTVPDGILSKYLAQKMPTTKLNGWYPCSEYTFDDAGSSTGELAQCAVYTAPLCYPGICETPEDVNPMVDIFVKRFPATVGSSDTASNIWLIAGGPGLASTVMEGYMTDVHAQLEGKVNVYTMDHRGTGRSTVLDCVASQVTTTGSPYGAGIDPSEVPACAEDLQIKYGDLASFSITTAATDLATFISKYSNGRSNIVYGVSYGTFLVERLMHLAPPEVTGYVLDSSMAASGAPGDDFPYFSNYDIDFDEVGDAFLSLCEKDNNCHDHFQPNGLNYTHQSLLEKFKKDPNSTCAQLVNGEPSFGLRISLGILLPDENLRSLIPPVIYRLNRCSAEDVSVLTQFLTALFPNTTTTTTTTTPQDSAYNSDLLYKLLLFSEMWESPMLPKPELKFAGGINYMIPQYCAFSKENSKDCIEFNNSNYDAHGIIYKRDQYWNKTATIPSQASVLLLSGTLDPQTPPKYAEQLFKALKGTKKELIKFDYATHGTLYSTQIVRGDLDTCGMRILASYVRNAGDLERLNTSCIDKLPAWNLTVPDDILSKYLGTNDAYDGMFNSNLISN
ncbi:hypothetical protein PHMEG_00012444 [Phytophthora megakarya]|uniref:Peptidase S33 tripeptidyl aminopeptidase-like C-terminal domain-containing protein n=1 Tax=Phytophthora megakarya TaxID=4795 RepID=A0A225WA51_9STRA|nr:hypothetical protein PHMEG_00012444 [Phytophthora megakarya]